MNKHRFVWHDLSTKDFDGSKRFYGEVFNWKFDDDASYAHIAVGDQKIGGVRKMGADEPQPTSWIGYIGVDDVAATVAAASGAGGKVYVPTTQIEGTGTFAVVADPTGAVFSPWKSARAGDAVEKLELAKPYTFCWDELMSTDPKAAVAFYEQLFGWKGRAVDMGGGMIYTLLDRPGVTNPKGDPAAAGGAMQSPPGVPYSFWIAYVAVDDCDQISARAEKLGAKVTMPPTDIPNVGRFAVWMDPQGASIAVLQPRM